MTEETLSAIQQGILGETSGKIALHGQEECYQTALTMLQQGRRQLDILSYDLDAPIYNREPFIEALKQLAIRSRYSQVRILLQNNERVQQDGHQIIKLWWRLTSKIEIRKIHHDYIEHPENFMLVDDVGYMQWSLYDRYVGTASFKGGLESAKYNELFHEIWEQSELDSELRHLHI